MARGGGRIGTGGGRSAGRATIGPSETAADEADDEHPPTPTRIDERLASWLSANDVDLRGASALSSPTPPWRRRTPRASSRAPSPRSWRSAPRPAAPSSWCSTRSTPSICARSRSSSAAPSGCSPSTSSSRPARAGRSARVGGRHRAAGGGARRHPGPRRRGRALETSGSASSPAATPWRWRVDRAAWERAADITYGPTSRDPGPTVADDGHGADASAPP
jgi:hypothetical protein